MRQVGRFRNAGLLAYQARLRGGDLEERETVVTFLKVVGGGSALLELESRQVSRSVRGDLNRVINAESANLQRAVAASARQLEAIGPSNRTAAWPSSRM